jgi:hypothetical protein
VVLQPNEIVSQFAAVIPRAVKGRRRFPLPARAIKVKLPPPWTGRRSLGWLNDVVYTRDTWMHRVDVARAAGKELALTADHDGRIVADVVADWAHVHGRPFELTLTGVAGGHYAQGTNGDVIEMDAVEFCRMLGGRVVAPALLATQVPF